MADSINMNGLSLEESQHASGYGGPGPRGGSAYIPPHLRAKVGGGPQGPPGPPPGMDGPPPMMNGNGVQTSAWAPQPR
jgi:ATP-dependent RNA helicase DDX3X